VSKASRRVGVYYAWSRPEETGAPLGVIENRFPTLFETRRMLYPRYTEFADTDRYDQGIGGFMDNILRHNFVAFVEQARAATGNPVAEIERVDAGGVLTPVSHEFTSGIDTLFVISFDSKRTGQGADADELDAMRRFLTTPGNLLVVSPHHDVGDAPEAEFRHHGDRTLPPEQRCGGFARSILGGSGSQSRIGSGCARRPTPTARHRRSWPSGSWTGSGSLRGS
jgi:hypothetical protein